jgi:hypothetical protein
MPFIYTKIAFLRSFLRHVRILSHTRSRRDAGFWLFVGPLPAITLGMARTARTKSPGSEDRLALASTVFAEMKARDYKSRTLAALRNGLLWGLLWGELRAPAARNVKPATRCLKYPEWSSCRAHGYPPIARPNGNCHLLLFDIDALLRPGASQSSASKSNRGHTARSWLTLKNPSDCLRARQFSGN